jgi:uncharacterized membrane protein
MHDDEPPVLELDLKEAVIHRFLSRLVRMAEYEDMHNHHALGLAS